MKTHTTAEAAEFFKCSERWLVEQIRAARFPASKVGRKWVMTEQDVQDALDICRNGASRPAPQQPAKVAQFSSMTSTTRRRAVGR